MRRSLSTGVVALFAVLVAVRAEAESPAPLAPLRFLLGAWVADARPGEGTGACAFHEDLQGQVIVRKNHAESPATGGRPASVHDDVMVIHADGAAARASYFDNEGHSIRYAVSSPVAGKVVFVSEPAPGPRYRLTYAATPDGRVAGTFEIAPSDKPDAFATFLQWSMHRPVASAR